MKNVAVGTAVAVSLFLLFEGLCSVAFVVYDLIRRRPILAESLHTRYDSELGWVGIPNLYLPDLYGPSKYVRTNNLGYRSDRDFAKHVPKGTVRILCSGDSFTFGYGVANDKTWCQGLQAQDRRLEPVNMGQGGYGVDQMFLWYRRDIDRMDIDVQILAPIELDFTRMLGDTFLGYGRPVLALRGGSLVNANSPVPRREWAARLVLMAPIVEELRFVALPRDIVGPKPSESAIADPYPVLRRVTAKQRQVVLTMFESLRDLNAARGRSFVFVRLPTEGDSDGIGTPDPWWNWISAELGKMNIPVIDLLPDFGRLPAAELGKMFIHESIKNYAGAKGHYSETGNAYAAKILYERLVSLPEIRNRLSASLAN